MPNDASLQIAPCGAQMLRDDALRAFSKVLIKEKHHKSEARKSARSVETEDDLADRKLIPHRDKGSALLTLK